MKMSKSAWPVMIVSQELNLGNDNGVRLREIAAELEHVQECKVIPSFTYEDAWELFLSRWLWTGTCRSTTARST